METEEKPGQGSITFKELGSVAVILGFPYLLVGFFWALAHTDHLQALYGADNLFSFIGEIVAWPVLIFSDITLK